MHKYLVYTRRLRVYWRGSFCLLEIDYGRIGRNERTIQIVTKKGLINRFTTNVEVLI
jgi:hypothetical protein